jgi:hypothetical protein
MIAVVEDALSEAVVRKLVATIRPDLTLFQVMRKNGRGYVQSRVRELNRTAQTVPVFVLVDLDTPTVCPATLITTLLPVPRASNLLFRVAVMEVESWLMADQELFAAFLGVQEHLVPDDPDGVIQPKELIVSLSMRSKRRDIRQDLVPASGDTRRVGPAFNARLITFIENLWRVDAAERSSPSLRKAVNRLRVAF